MSNYIKHYFLISLLFICHNAAQAQRTLTVAEVKAAPTVTTLYGMFPQYPITLDTLNAFEDFIIIKGKLVDSTNATFGCGIYSDGGTLKIKLTRRNRKYKHKYAYIVMACMQKVPAELKNKKEWELKKIPMKPKSCILNANNKFDTKGIPFYELAGFGK